MANEYLPENVRELIGKEFEPQPAAVVVERALIDHWVEAYQDANPLYSDDEYAKKSKYGGIIAPPGMLQTWTFPYYWLPATGPVDREKGMMTLRVKKLLGLTGGLMVQTSIDWFLPVRLGDRLNFTEVLTDVSPLKKTSVGVGHFCEMTLKIRNQNGELVGQMTKTNFNYNPT